MNNNESIVWVALGVIVIFGTLFVIRDSMNQGEDESLSELSSEMINI